ncbi:Magnesium transporter MRS2-2 [Picochlorum sp. SENEW3]|nr:Magnesium transporter MRS2-2 [Picochlorum sp. SENEW3]
MFIRSWKKEDGSTTPLLLSEHSSHHPTTTPAAGDHIVCIAETLDGQDISNKRLYSASLNQYDVHEMIEIGACTLRTSACFDPRFTPPFPTVFSIRQRSILFSMHCIRMIICPKKCYIISIPKINEPFTPQPADAVYHPFVARVMEMLNQGDDTVPFELKLLDAAVYGVVHAYEAEIFELEHDAHAHGSKLAKISDTHEMTLVETMHEIKVRMSKINASLEEIQKELDTMFSDDMSQYRAFWGNNNTSDDHVQLAEDILQDMYLNVTFGLRRLRILSEYIESREMMARISLDARRNQLVGLELLISNISLGFGWASMLGGIFGMNLWNMYFADSKPIFLVVMFVLTVGTIAFPIYFRNFMRKKRLQFLPETIAS